MSIRNTNNVLQNKTALLYFLLYTEQCRVYRRKLFLGRWDGGALALMQVVCSLIKWNILFLPLQSKLFLLWSFVWSGTGWFESKGHSSTGLKGKCSWSGSSRVGGTSSSPHRRASHVIVVSDNDLRVSFVRPQTFENLGWYRISVTESVFVKQRGDCACQTGSAGHVVVWCGCPQVPSGWCVLHFTLTAPWSCNTKCVQRRLHWLCLHCCANRVMLFHVHDLSTLAC